MPGKVSRFVGTKHEQRASAKQASRVDRVAATILAGDHGTLHRPGDRPDLCPRCSPEVDARLLGEPIEKPSRTWVPRKPAPKRAPAVREAKPVKLTRQRPGRPRLDEDSLNKTQLNIRVTADHRVEMRARAADSGMTLSEWVRGALLAALESE